MDIVEFTHQHIPAAQAITKETYLQAQRQIPALPDWNQPPEFTGLAENRLGVAAVANGELLGYLCCFSPFPNAFRTTGVRGVFSPLHGSGVATRVAGASRADLYARLYQAAAQRWVKAGAASHGICLYAGDTEAQRQLVLYGFGMRCIDAIRVVDAVEVGPCQGYTFAELPREEYGLILPLNRLLVRHLEQSPSFMKYPHLTDEELSNQIHQPDARYFVARADGQVVAYMKLCPEGETFVCTAQGMTNIGGAFCLPEHRGRGVYQNLLNFATGQLSREGFTRMGVDCESINPTAHRFWGKYFAPYTYSFVRRIDEYTFR